MSTENNDERTPAAGPADAGQQAGGSNNGSGSSRPSGRLGQRPQRDRNNRGPARPTESAPREKKFTGRCEELMGEIYDCSANNQVDGYTKTTTKEVAEYVGRTYSSDARTAVETLILPTFDYPSDPVTGASETEKRKWTKRVDTMVCREDRFDEDLKKVCSLIWGQCTELLRAKLQAKDGYDQMKAEHDTVELLKSKDCVFKFSDQKKAAHSLHEALRKFYKGHQEKSSNAQDYYQRFKNHLEVAWHCGRSLANHQGLIDKKLEERGLSIVTCSVNEHREAITDSREECLACAVLLGSDRK
jgi:hypothetical protein